MRPQVGLLCLSMLLTPVMAHAQVAGVGEAVGTSDSDGFHSLQSRAGVLFDYASSLRFTGAALHWTRYWQDEWSADEAGVVFIYRHQNADDLAGPRIEAGFVRIGGHTRPSADASWTFRMGERTGLQLILVADPIETAAAIDEGVAYGLGAVTLEQRFGDRLTLVGLAGYQGFTDGNNRLHARARVIWSFLPEQGLHAQVRWRGFDGSGGDVPVTYFNPDRYGRWDVGLYLRRWHRGWRFYGMGALGRESIAASGSHTSAALEFRVQSPIQGRMHIEVFAAYTRSADVVVARDDDYAYGRAGLMLVVPLGGT